MGKLIHICLWMVLASASFAQPAAKVATPATKEAEPASAPPSRLVSAAELGAYLEARASLFLIRRRALDPFGQAQDPDAKRVVKTSVAKTTRRVAPILETPFSDIVRLITVTTIMPKEQRFLVGTRSIKKGDQIPLTFRGKPIRVQVIEVTSRQIGFRNLDTGEEASRKLNLLPAGMIPGHQGITAPGMAPDRANAPIELEAPSPTP